MPGVRIHHRQARSCRVELWHPGSLYRKPKAYFVDVDAEGDAIVSETVWRRLQEACAALQVCPFLLLNEVKRPPTLIVDPRNPIPRVYRNDLIGTTAAEVRTGGPPHVRRTNCAR